MALYLALDVGGTKTAAALADEERVLAQASSGSIKTLRLAPEEAAANLRNVLNRLQSQTGLHLPGAITRTCIGTSGAAAPGVRGWMEAALLDAVGGTVLLLGDEVIALDAAFRGGRGALVIAGTGSNIVGRARSGQMVHTGGWGPALADEGSGHWIGTEALRSCFRAIDAAEPSTADAVYGDGHRHLIDPAHLPLLLRRMMGSLGLETLGDLIGAANAPGFRSAALVPVIAEVARDGDPLAAEVLERAGQDLAGLVSAVIRKVEALEKAVSGQFTPPKVAFVGGILSHLPEVRQAMHGGLRRRYPEITLQPEPVDPLEGALWHARSCP